MTPHPPVLVRPSDLPTQPWKNGGGLMRELRVWPDGDDWHARVGVADITADGPFSFFPGVQRWFTVLKGDGVELAVTGSAGRALHRRTRADAPLCFDGAAATGCRLLGGPTHVLNLMLREARGGMEVALDGQPWTPGPGACGLFSAVAGRCAGVAVPAYTLLWFDAAPTALVFEAGSRPAGAIGWWLAVAPGSAP